jgi:hypothetical protein
MNLIAPLSSEHESKCNLSEIISLSVETGGCTCGIASFTDQGPKPGKSTLSLTAIVKSWCQVTYQLESGVLSKKIARTGRAFTPMTPEAMAISSADFAKSMTSGQHRKRYLNPALTVPPSNCPGEHWKNRISQQQIRFDRYRGVDKSLSGSSRHFKRI